MPVYEPFFKRRKRERGELPEIFQTETMSPELRNQLQTIFYECLGSPSAGSNNDLHVAVADIVIRELGQKKSYGYVSSYINKIFDEYQDVEVVLSLIEMAIRIRRNLIKDRYISDHSFNSYLSASSTTDEIVEEINVRFRESGFGYQLENDKLIPVDSHFTHHEIVKPVLIALSDPRFEGAQEEFFGGFEKYKQGDTKECLRECSNVIESVLKSILRINDWDLPTKQTASQLMESAKINGLFPSFLLAHYNSLVSLVGSGVPQIRNNMAGHGQGVESTTVPDYFARYAINLTATTILFLIHSQKDYETQQKV